MRLTLYIFFSSILKFFTMFKYDIHIFHSRKACVYLCRFSRPESLGRTIAHLGNSGLRPSARRFYDDWYTRSSWWSWRCDPRTKGLILEYLGFALAASMASNGVWSAGRATRDVRCSSLAASMCNVGATLRIWAPQR